VLAGIPRAAVREALASIRHGGIVIAAGHDHAALRRLCDRALLLDRSGVRAVESFDHLRNELASGTGRA
jgi:ABC-type polysaccharide/polyol phosphate transport system ATPase subunit